MGVARTGLSKGTGLQSLRQGLIAAGLIEPHRLAEQALQQGQIGRELALSQVSPVQPGAQAAVVLAGEGTEVAWKRGRLWSCSAPQGVSWAGTRSKL